MEQYISLSHKVWNNLACNLTILLNVQLFLGGKNIVSTNQNAERVTVIEQQENLERTVQFL